jgi:hypothetical protein
LVLYLVHFYFLNGAARNTAPSRCIEAPRAPLERALYPGRPRPRREVLASRGVVVVASWQGQAAGAYLRSREGGPHTLPTPETS